MRSAWSFYKAVLAVGFALLVGCEIEVERPSAPPTQGVRVPPRQAEHVGKGQFTGFPDPATRTDLRTADPPADGKPRRGMRSLLGGQSQQDAVDRISAEIADASQLRKTLVVWLIEKSPEAESLVKNMTGAITRLMREPAANPSNPVEMAVIGYGDEVELITPKPATDVETLEAALGKLTTDDGKQQLVCGALEKAVETFMPQRMAGDELIFVLVGVSRGTDLAKADPILAELKRAAVPVFGIGPAVPFGAERNRTGEMRSAMMRRAQDRRGRRRNDRNMEDGPDMEAPAPRDYESLYPERIQLTLSGGEDTSDLRDSGYGPFGLELICRKSGGRFYRLYDVAADDWEIDEATGDVKPALLAKYAPDYVDEAEYRRLLAENKCRQALHNAALLPPTDALGSVRTEFRKERDEAATARAISAAQREAAVRDQPIQKLYEALVAGESDRPKLTGARWQAAYDLAMGQVLAAKARLDGYNAMLAILKQGKSFSDPKSTRWVLEPADEIAASSALDKMAKNSRVYLKRVVAEHPGTPWAAVAERELRYPAGWKFVEK